MKNSFKKLSIITTLIFSSQADVNATLFASIANDLSFNNTEEQVVSEEQVSTPKSNEPTRSKGCRTCCKSCKKGGPCEGTKK